ncbi:hypothetical protein KC644_01855 [Candidatus Berkelbacteria bacterium]|nr:hypothetical protein [Candidatus Berkelbacteria bacterium]
MEKNHSEMIEKLLKGLSKAIMLDDSLLEDKLNFAFGMKSMKRLNVDKRTLIERSVQKRPHCSSHHLVLGLVLDLLAGHPETNKDQASVLANLSVAAIDIGHAKAAARGNWIACIPQNRETQTCPGFLDELQFVCS